MNKQEFIEKIVGTPWVNRAHSFDECDCFGLVYLYMKHVTGICPELTDDYLTGEDFAKAFSSQLESGKWVKQDRQDADTIVFMMYANDIPMHCGVMLDRVNCIHAFGSEGKGRVAVWKLSQVKSFLIGRFGEPRVEFYKWVN